MTTMADYFSTTMTADYTTTTLNSGNSLNPQVEFNETPKKNQVEHEFYDGTTEKVNLSDTIFFDGNLQWPKGISDTDAGTVTDFYVNSTKSDFGKRSIYFKHPTDGNTYVMKFRGELTRKKVAGKVGYIQIPSIPVRFIGVKA